MIFENNTGEFGAGLRYESDTCSFGPSVASIVGNTFLNNTATEDGGGLHVTAGVNGDSCQVNPVSVLIEGNDFIGNTANDDGGGIQAVTDTFPNSEFADLIVRDNYFSANTANDEGGGMRIEALGEGTETLIVSGNTTDRPEAIEK